MWQTLKGNTIHASDNKEMRQAHLGAWLSGLCLGGDCKTGSASVRVPSEICGRGRKGWRTKQLAVLMKSRAVALALPRSPWQPTSILSEMCAFALVRVGHSK